MSQSLEQKRAAYAWQRVNEKEVTTDYVNLAKAAPSLIMSNGLMQTLAFFKSKGKDHHNKLLEHILGWLTQPEAACTFVTSKEFSAAMSQLASEKITSEQYLHATQEALAILKWIRQFAAAKG
ncbi:MAG: type III-B CRISPR module-associated protein Cmr5 [Thermoanaerobaculum sp.]|nr:type III-B CRISPR module-associated protein Cmr5 [Thermoanaerobaculum sp.]MDW7966932.1 type III-B CRISPR module-associated protein Cmr5 [Thermoanaerobaculum sp.]